MESMNKFKVLTIIVICLFLFVIGAIYSNTKDASSNKIQQRSEAVSDDARNNRETYNQQIIQNTQANNELTVEIENLNRRIDELSQKVNENSSDSLKCKIVGSLGDNGIEQLTEDAVLQEAKYNNRDIVITCSF